MTKLSKKQLIIGILALVLSLGLVGCGKKSVPAANTNQDVNQAVNQDVNTNIATTTAATSTAEMDTSNWKTYRNEEYGFEVMYPGDWFLDKCSIGSASTLLMMADVSIKCNGNFNDAKISIEKVNNNYDWQPRLKDYQKDNIIIDGNKFIKVSGDLPYEDPEGNVIPNTWVRIIDMSIQIPGKNIYIVLRFHRGYGNIGLPQLENDIKVYNDLVKSFRFIK
jgi:hypothetical protein